MSDTLVTALESLRTAEKAQAMRYRRLAALAEELGDEQTAQRLHDLHADEQHHLSRLTARLVELGRTPADLAPVSSSGELAGWEERTRRYEQDEVDRYETFLRGELDPQTRALADSILEVERQHRDRLSGKWTLA